MARPGSCLTRRGFAVGAGVAAAAVVAATGAREGRAAERETPRVAERFGIGYLPPHLIREQGLVGRQARARGREVAAEWAGLSGGAVLPYRRVEGARIDDGFLLGIIGNT